MKSNEQASAAPKAAEYIRIERKTRPAFGVGWMQLLCTYIDFQSDFIHFVHI